MTNQKPNDVTIREVTELNAFPTLALTEYIIAGHLKAGDGLCRITSYNVCYTKLLRHTSTKIIGIGII